ncbi:DNA polymerase III subunit epsilon [Phaeobacter italicus]|jgi:DNA polymerase-3 subunit epsilon|uniref:DNA polymerase III subunit epsilon n=1 Tax=Phaeobacter italicus TaxID=481446 RepID=A0A0H5D6E4_9RHOB|nr:DNA polymerase III subunit epsilon [Phaeobacter italicus]EEB72381.1 DNA polymerase III, epsilon subunit [Ruegeria sp. R11]MEC8016415.1 DNA polymerase III subunit epsilon [Pseudomonadota bacterium]MBY5977633.1 DNA polymerase III subunit epsilon [Phaeobacter italicus]MCA0857688.1 DNA polymerase III subunit epsilon [Phaeobacter italicus]MEC8573470.1 DNA polymerase III subunit epsilon [Pseudomonadota bacterium]
MREIVLDTETTGFDPFSGDRIVEIGAVELLNHMPTGETFHVYINPERSMPAEAFGVHGIGPDLLEPPQQPAPGAVTLRDKPVFAKVGKAFVDFVRDSKMIIHNASFDMKFLNYELERMGLAALPMDQAVDTLAIARKRFPGSPATLDALCRRFNIDNSNRTLHGALLDSEILADVYLELIGGRQPDFGLSTAKSEKSSTVQVDDWRPTARPSPLPPRITEQEKEAHAAFVAKMGEGALWNGAGD